MNGRIAFVTSNAVIAAGMESEADEPGVVVAGMGADIVNMLRDSGVPAVSIDEDPDDPLLGEATIGGADVLGHGRVVDAIRSNGVTAIVPFKTSTALEKIASDLGLALLAAPARLSRQLENKLSLGAIADAAGVTVPTSVTVRVDEQIIDRVRSGELELPLVYQPATGFAGEGTTPLRNVHDIAQLVLGHRGSAGKLATLVEGEPVTVTGVVFDDGEVLAGPVTRQLTGVEQLTTVPYASCGNDWSLAVAEDAQREVRRVCHAIGGVLGSRGFVGTYGIDIVLADDGSAQLIEINPRWTASLAFQAQLQRAADLPTLVQAHLAAFGYSSVDRTRLRDVWSPDTDPVSIGPGSTILVGNTVLDVAMASEFQSGIYRVDDAGARRIRAGWRIDQLADDREHVVLRTGDDRRVEPSANRFRIHSRCGAVSDPLARTLASDASHIVKSLLAVARPVDGPTAPALQPNAGSASIQR